MLSSRLVYFYSKQYQINTCAAKCLVTVSIIWIMEYEKEKYKIDKRFIKVDKFQSTTNFNIYIYILFEKRSIRNRKVSCNNMNHNTICKCICTIPMSNHKKLTLLFAFCACFNNNYMDTHRNICMYRIYSLHVYYQYHDIYIYISKG